MKKTAVENLKVCDRAEIVRHDDAAFTISVYRDGYDWPSAIHGSDGIIIYKTETLARRAIKRLRPDLSPTLYDMGETTEPEYDDGFDANDVLLDLFLDGEACVEITKTGDEEYRITTLEGVIIPFDAVSIPLIPEAEWLQKLHVVNLTYRDRDIAKLILPVNYLRRFYTLVGLMHRVGEAVVEHETAMAREEED